MKEFIVTFRFTDDRGYRSEDCFILQASDIKAATKMARIIVRTTHEIVSVQERN